MKIFNKSIAFLFLAIFTANAFAEQYKEENVAAPPESDNTRVSLYLHPVILLIGANTEQLLLYSTVEIPFSLYNALIVKPSVWNFGDILRLGSDIGLRHYAAGRGEGFYLQPQVGLFFLSAKDSWSFDVDWDEGDVEIKKIKKGPWYDFMGYLGYAHKFAYVNVYYDAGIGYACIHSVSACSVIFDANVGVGISF